MFCLVCIEFRNTGWVGACSVWTSWTADFLIEKLWVLIALIHLHSPSTGWYFPKRRCQLVQEEGREEGSEREWLTTPVIIWFERSPGCVYSGLCVRLCGSNEMTFTKKISPHKGFRSPCLCNHHIKNEISTFNWLFEEFSGIESRKSSKGQLCFVCFFNRCMF